MTLADPDPSPWSTLFLQQLQTDSGSELHLIDKYYIVAPHVLITTSTSLVASPHKSNAHSIIYNCHINDLVVKMMHTIS